VYNRYKKKRNQLWTLFVWSDLNELGDLKDYDLYLIIYPEFMQKLEYERGNGRDDYPVRAMWNSILASIHQLKVSQLRFMCGFYG
jgi:hypothetical protein